MALSKKIIVTRATDISSDARSQKAVRWLADAGYNVISVSWPRGSSGPPPEWNDVEFIAAELTGKHGSGLKNLLPLFRWGLFLVRTIWRHRTGLVAVHAMDMDTGLPVRFISRLLRAKFVYDICDFYSVSRFPNGPGWLASIAQKIEMRLVKNSDAVILPTKSREVLFAGNKPRRLVIVPNVPAYRPEIPNHGPSRPFTVLYVGVLSLRRGLRELVEAVKSHQEWRLVLGGIGEDEDAIRESAIGAANVEFIGKIPYSDVLEWTAKADVLPVTYDPTFANHRHSSPNKLYEGMMAGIPLIVARSTGVDEDVTRYGLGEIVEYGDVTDLENALAKIAGTTEQERQCFKEKAQSLFEAEFSPEAVGDRLKELYRDLCGDPS